VDGATSIVGIGQKPLARVPLLTLVFLVLVVGKILLTQEEIVTDVVVVPLSVTLQK